MIRIEISSAAYDAIAASTDGPLMEPHRGPEGRFYLWLTPETADRLTAARRPSESYSDAIERLAMMESRL
jgi:hypothetical protein